MTRQSLLLQDTTYVYDEAGHHLGKYLGIGNKNPGEEVIYLDDMPIAMTIGGVLSYLETDHLGTPRVAANPATNALQWEWDFFGDAFGANAATSAPSGGIDVKLRYPGQYSDGESGLHYNYFRDYEPGTGRYIESDPIGLGGGIDTYAYALGNTFQFIDSLGLCSCVADPNSGRYGPNGGKRNWLFREVWSVICDYNCTSGNKASTVSGSRTVTFWFESGYELSCYGVNYVNNPPISYEYRITSADSFDPRESDVPELRRWAQQNCEDCEK